MRLRYFWGLLLFSTTFAACSSQSSIDKLAKELETASSWAATAQMVGEAWLQKTVPTAYAKQTLQSTKDQLQKSADMLAKNSSENQSQSISTLRQLERTVDQLANAIDQEDQGAMTRALQKLSTQKQSLKALVKATGG